MDLWWTELKMNWKACRFLNGLPLKNDKYNNLRTSKQTKIHQKSNVAYQERIRIEFLFNLKLNHCVECNKRAGEMSKWNWQSHGLE